MVKAFATAKRTTGKRTWHTKLPLGMASDARAAQPFELERSRYNLRARPCCVNRSSHAASQLQHGPHSVTSQSAPQSSSSNARSFPSR